MTTGRRPVVVTLTDCGCTVEDKQRREEGWFGKEGADMGEIARALAVSLMLQAHPDVPISAPNLVRVRRLGRWKPS
jgi:hypothetical protein